MKRVLILAGIVVLGMMFYASSCLDDDTSDDGKTQDPEVVDNGNTKPDDNNTNKPDNTKPDDNNNSNPDDDNNGSQASATEFTAEEIAKANTAADVKSMTQMEKDIVFYCNLARLDGTKFWETYHAEYITSNSANVVSLEEDLRTIKDLPMLVPEKSLMAAAAAHAQDMSDNDFFDHTSFDGTDFAQRVYCYYSGNAIAENLSAGKSTAMGVVIQLLVDEGVRSLGHRHNILDDRYCAIGVKTTTHKTWRTITVQDFGDTMNEKME